MPENIRSKVNVSFRVLFVHVINLDLFGYMQVQVFSFIFRFNLSSDIQVLNFKETVDF